MKTRILAAAVLLPLLLLFLLVLPKICTAVLFSAMAAIGAYELLQGTKLVTHKRLIVYAMISAFIVPIWSFFGCVYAFALMGILVFTALLYMELLLSKGKLPYTQVAVTFMAGIVVPFMLSAVVRIFATEKGIYLVFIPFVLSMVSDTGAYFAGRFFGKHKLAPVVSPNKTVEGVIGGVLMTVLGMVVYCLIMQFGFNLKVNYFYAVLYGIVGALAGVFGDLSFSAIKRQTGIKDYGNLIPGHGGILDRFDSTTVVAPLTEALLLLIPVVM
ncbi:MAG: phosphatidate cytidylyltransferase [Ruminococcaceae bacterium]|nr:phosphatidate cytidylyltransferase [Oscillospiraceae bacterium]